MKKKSKKDLAQEYRFRNMGNCISCYKDSNNKITIDFTVKGEYSDYVFDSNEEVEVFINKLKELL